MRTLLLERGGWAIWHATHCGEYHCDNASPCIQIEQTLPTARTVHMHWHVRRWFRDRPIATILGKAMTYIAGATEQEIRQREEALLAKEIALAIADLSQ